MIYREDACHTCRHYKRIPLSDHKPCLVDNICDIDKHEIMSWDFCEYVCDKYERKEGEANDRDQ